MPCILLLNFLLMIDFLFESIDIFWFLFLIAINGVRFLLFFAIEFGEMCIHVIFPFS